MIREDVVLQKIHELLPNVPPSFDGEQNRAEVDKRAAPTVSGGKVHQPFDVCAKQECEGCE
jgi:hypothetical protein